MIFKKFLAKFFRQDEDLESLKLHVAGATVRHRSPFDNIMVSRNEKELSREFVRKWVVPFYMVGLANADEATIKTFATAASQITEEVVGRLLGDFDWRSRLSGAYFAAINNYVGLEEIIGGHLLKSEVCYAGEGYCLALANFNTDASRKYLELYLNYYLGQIHLQFDQSDAFCALQYVDKSLSDKLLDKWNTFTADKKRINLEKELHRFNGRMQAIAKIRQVNVQP